MYDDDGVVGVDVVAVVNCVVAVVGVIVSSIFSFVIIAVDIEDGALVAAAVCVCVCVWMDGWGIKRLELVTET